MTILDDLAELLVMIAERQGVNPLDVLDLIQEGEDPEAILAAYLDEATPSDDLAAFLIDTVEEFVVSDLTQAGELRPENVEAVNDDAEGNAVLALTAVIALSAVVETVSAGQIDETTTQITQALVGLGIDDVTGAELTARYQEGVLPALEAKVAKEHVPQFVSLQDAIEFSLRTKDTDQGYLRASGASDRARDRIGSNVPVDEENILEEWGIRPDQLPILELVALESMEFEELIETPAELGLIVDDEVLDLVLDLAGYPEPLKDFLREVPAEIPRSNRLWEERTAVEPLVDELETLAADEEISPRDAVDLLPAEVDPATEALEDRFRNLRLPPSGAPTRSLLESSFARGYSTRDELVDRLDRLEYDVDRYDDVVATTILEELDGSLQEAVALGLVDEGTYSDLAEEVGLDDETIEALLTGSSFSDLVNRRLQEERAPEEAPVRSILGVGSGRAGALEGAGIETVEDLAGADLETVVEEVGLAPEVARQLIARANNRIS